MIFHPPNLYPDQAKILRKVILQQEIANLMRDQILVLPVEWENIAI